MDKTVKRLLEVAETNGWSTEQECDNVYSLGRFSPAGQDFHISIDTEDDPWSFIENLRAIILDFDVSYEAYIWLDDTGHGANGAPYDMKDVYEDMEACLEMMEKLKNDLAEALEELEFE